MKALLLAAGLGTRLRPYTYNLPKALFTIANQTLLDQLIQKLIQAGCRDIAINTHHLHQHLEKFLQSQNYPVRVKTMYEPVLLGAGALKKAGLLWGPSPFMVINTDIVTDIDFKIIYQFHLNHHDPVTMVLYDQPGINTVAYRADGFITGFNAQTQGLTFTGIQVLNPLVLEYIPVGIFSNPIHIYQYLITKGYGIKAYISKDYWQDIGTPTNYTRVVLQKMLARLGPQYSGQFKSFKLKGDGSDRQWQRITHGKNSLIAVDHGIHTKTSKSEVQAFVKIGQHLLSKNLPLPQIYQYDYLAGLVVMQDLGDIRLETIIKKAPAHSIETYYRRVIDILIRLNQEGGEDFQTSWSWQSQFYDQELILEKECRYYMQAFIQGYLGLDLSFKDFAQEFKVLANKALENGLMGFMHRDFQSRNIMVCQNQIYIIDFQGGRFGPLQYDLASLLIDPYVMLPPDLQISLAEYCAQKISIPLDAFMNSYHYCCITRSLQILGAFAFLTARAKIGFEQYLVPATATLNRCLHKFKDDFPGLQEITYGKKY